MKGFARLFILFFFTTFCAQEVKVSTGKIERIEKDYKAAQKLFKLTDFLLQSEDQANAQQIAALEILKTKAVEVQQKNSPLQILKLEVRQKLLQQEKLLLAEIVTQPFIEKAST